MLTMFDKQINLRMGQANVKRWIDDIMPLLEDEDVLGVDGFATHRLPLDAAPQAYETFQKKQDGAIKILRAAAPRRPTCRARCPGRSTRPSSAMTAPSPRRTCDRRPDRLATRERLRTDRSSRSCAGGWSPTSRRPVDQVALRGAEGRGRREEPLREALHHADRTRRQQHPPPRRARNGTENSTSRPPRPSAKASESDGVAAQGELDVAARGRVRIASAHRGREHPARGVEHGHALALGGGAGRHDRPAQRLRAAAELLLAAAGVLDDGNALAITSAVRPARRWIASSSESRAC